MTLEIIVFISAALFGILWYWRESRSNRTFRMFNRITHAKHLQMKPENRKGFLHEQNFLLRLVHITIVFIIVALVVMALTPISLASIVAMQMFIACIVGTLLGSYVASLVLFTSKTIEDNSDVVEDKLEETFNKGKAYIDDLRGEHKPTPEPQQKAEAQPRPESTDVPKKKSARDRLRDKGYLD